MRLDVVKMVDELFGGWDMGGGGGEKIGFRVETIVCEKGRLTDG